MRLTRPWRRLLALVLGTAMTATAQAATPLPMLHADGPNLVDPAGKPMVLKGCNLGNYLMLEGWMFGGTLQQAGKGIRDGATYYRTIRQRFGDERAEKLIASYREGWITPRDFEQIKGYGFNVVRLPFDCRLIQEDAPPYKIRPDGFKWLDHAVDMAEAAGIYTILDLHGVPGGQSREDHTGEAGQNHLWDDETCQQRTVDVWKALAEHFKDRSAVAAYDLMNEPYGDHKQDVRPVLKRLMPQITRAIRDLGDNHVVYFPAPLTGGVGFYGDPHEQGLTGVAFTEHFYPGLFGGKPGMETQARLLNVTMPAKRQQMQKVASPYLVGEFNVVLEKNGSDRMMRAYYDRAAEYGWQATMWSYKLLKRDGGSGPNSWYLATNADPLPTVDIATCTYEELEAFIAKLPTMPLTVHKTLHEMLTTPTPPPLTLPDVTRPAATAPAAARWPERVFVPYLYLGNDDQFSMSDCERVTGQKFYTLAFVIADKQGQPTWYGHVPMEQGLYAKEIETIRGRGGDVICSFGGEAGTELAMTERDEDALQRKYQSVIDRYHFTWLDFDIEGKNLEQHPEDSRRRNAVLANLQKANPGLRTSFTLPVAPTGLSEASLALLSDAKAKGVAVYSANIMTMFFGREFIGKGKSEADLSIDAANATHTQLAKIDPAIRISLCPCIGKNGKGGEAFTTADAKALRAFADRTPWVCNLTYWSINRDSMSGRGDDTQSGVEQRPFEFAEAFKSFTSVGK